MRIVSRGVLACGIAVAVGVAATAGKPERVEPFAATDAVSGKAWQSADAMKDAKAAVVVFLGTECPVNNQYAGTLAKLHAEYRPKGVTFVGVNSNSQDDAVEVAKHAKEYGLTFAVLKDADAKIADRFAAERTPEAFVLTPNGEVAYRGRIDDQYGRGVKRTAPTKRDLADALDAVLAGKAVATPNTEVIGCLISRPVTTKAAAEPVTYTKHVARIIQNNCQVCHRAGEIGPFQLNSFKQAKAWSAAIKEEVSELRMPPWHAADPHGTFANDRRLSDADKKTLLAWIDQGCPEGDPNDLPPAKTFTAGWNIAPPHQIVTMNEEFPVPVEMPKGGLPYQYFRGGEPFAEEKWVQASEVRPGDRSVVHHIIVYIVPTDAKLPKRITGLDDLGGGPFGPPQLMAFVPGDQAVTYPPELALRIPKGSQLVFEVHYTPDGKPHKDRSAVGLVFADGPPTHEVRTDAAVNTGFKIPARRADHRVAAGLTVDKDLMLLSMNPHMHLRGKAFAYTLKTPDGKTEPLLTVPRYDFNWQTTYTLAKPRLIPKGSEILCEARYDNSAGNPNNPDPTKPVKWGDQTWEEMMIGFFNAYEVKK